MSYCAELVTFTLTSDVDEYVRLRKAAITEVKAAHPKLLAVPFCGRRADGTWADLWIYETQEAADAANGDVENLPEFLKMFAVLDGVEIEVIDFPESAVSPIA
ncbi:hypothetical protein MPY17_30605 [Rhodococcus opacus]|uniref:hypothetical protein n=1 Tax=Rhodococcus opacus TaxID=37919 RepID=UPI001FF1BB0D|nr:hypothetical protein [Rhodococcus opacus]UOT03255.1 hypothetical protein MPY17_30605 [Rhodococcus opacus]